MRVSDIHKLIITLTLSLSAQLSLADEVSTYLDSGAPGLPMAQEDPGVFRVCAPKDNLPFSNENGEGFENKIAEVLAKDLRLPLPFY